MGLKDLADANCNPYRTEIMSSFRDNAPDVDAITTYDRRCLQLYIMLIDADDAGASWQEAYEWAFQEKIGPDNKAANSRYRSHLRRARWMTKTGYRFLLSEKR